jgi:hypothetical protein
VIRFQTYLEEKQAQQLADLSKQLGISRAELIREGVDLVLQRNITADDDPLMGLIGQAGKVGRSDISEHHDSYLSKISEVSG